MPHASTISNIDTKSSKSSDPTTHIGLTRSSTACARTAEVRTDRSAAREGAPTDGRRLGAMIASGTIGRGPWVCLKRSGGMIRGHEAPWMQAVAERPCVLGPQRSRDCRDGYQGTRQTNANVIGECEQVYGNVASDTTAVRKTYAVYMTSGYMVSVWQM